jgi:elongation factor P
MINVNNFKGGISFEEKGDIFVVLSASHSKQGRGQATVKAKVKNLRTGATTIKSFTGGDKVNPAHISRVETDFLYNAGKAIVLMNSKNYEQYEMSLSKVE